jgi:hypothetical protein
MSEPAMTFDVTFREFQQLQQHRARRMVAKDRAGQFHALGSVVLCALFLTLAIYVTVQSYHLRGLVALDLPYPASAYLVLIFCLIAGIASLWPAMKLRLKLPRMQVSDDGALLGHTTLSSEPAGLRIERHTVSSKWYWPAFQGVEMAKTAVVLAIDNGIGLIVPARAFASDAARFEFAAVSQHLGAFRQAKR